MEVKKLVYLYLINYAKSNPDLTIMAVNSFVKDSEHASPLIRALAIRTMGCIRVEKIVEYLAPPLKKALGDDDPYVRKTVWITLEKMNTHWMFFHIFMRYSRAGCFVCCKTLRHLPCHCAHPRLHR